MVRFEKGQDKEKTARPFLEMAAREGKERVVLIGIAQEKASVWRSWNGSPYTLSKTAMRACNVVASNPGRTSICVMVMWSPSLV